MEKQSLIGNLDINQILSDTYVQRIFLSTDYEKVYESLRLYSQRSSHDLNIQKNLKNILFIYYLRMSSKKIVRKNYFERILIRMESFLDEEVLAFLLSQDLDMNYVGLDMYDTPVSLIDELALNINSSIIMNKFLEKIKKSNKKYFGISSYRNHTDLCRMNIIAGNLDKALEIFNSEDYNLFFKNIDEDYIFENFKQGKVCLFIKNFLGEQSDILFQIINTIKDSQNTPENKKLFLTQILYNEKIRIFNISCLSLIEDILGLEDYQKFVEYIKDRTAQKEMVLFSIRIKDDTLFYESLENTFPEPDKVLNLETPNNK